MKSKSSVLYYLLSEEGVRSTEMCTKIGCTEIMIIFYDSELNIFYDSDGLEMHYIFEIFKPNDLMLFMDDYGNNIFIHKSDRNTMVEILVDYEKE